jgi:hypothetical protein
MKIWKQLSPLFAQHRACTPFGESVNGNHHERRTCGTRTWSRSRRLTPAQNARGRIPLWLKAFSSPIPETSSNAGDSMAQAQRITSRRQKIAWFLGPSTPITSWLPFKKSNRWTSESQKMSQSGSSADVLARGVPPGIPSNSCEQTFHHSSLKWKEERKLKIVSHRGCSCTFDSANIRAS